MQCSWWRTLRQLFDRRATTPTDTGMVVVSADADRVAHQDVAVAPAAADTLARDRNGGSYVDIPASGAISAFQIMRTPVTNAMYRRAVDAGVCPEPDGRGGARLRLPAYAEHPVVQVRIGDARAYADWVGGLLPDDASWMRAAFGDDGRPYPWGHEPPAAHRANLWFSQALLYGGGLPPDDTTPVGRYPAGASPFGALDMLGNVWEWIDGPRPIARGGAFSTAGHQVHRGMLVHIPPAGTSPAIGVRVMRRSRARPAAPPEHAGSVE